MLSSDSEQKFHNDKKPKKKYQKFKETQEKNKSVDKTENSLPNETSEKSPGFVDMKNCPELRASGRQNKNSFFETKTNRSQFKSDKPCSSIVTGRNERKLNENLFFDIKTESSQCKSEKPSPSVITSRSERRQIEAFPPLVSTGNVGKDETRKDNSTAQTVPGNVTSVSSNTGRNEKSVARDKERPAAKKSTVQPQRNPNKKKRSEPVFINFQDILAANKIRRNRGRNQQKILRSKFQRHRGNELLSGNYLDSSNPVRNRGKHREIKKDKLNNFKKTIIKERIIKSKMREMAVATKFGSGSINLLDKIDFKTEIKIYLNELKNKKLKNLEMKKAKVSENVNVEKPKTERIDTKLEGKKEDLENISAVKEKIIPCTTPDGEIKFSSKFREYCDNIITPDLNSAVARLIEELIRIQDRLFLRDPIKAKARKRHVSGIKEVRKYLCLKKAKLIIIAPNLEKLQMEGSVYDSVNELKAMADSENVPYGFALDRYKLGRYTKKNVPVSAFAVLSYEGLEALFENAIHELQEAKKKFLEVVKPKTVEDKEDVNSRLISALVSAFEELQVPKEASSDVN